MKLPEYLRTFSPVGEVLRAEEAGEAALAEEIALRNGRLLIGTADEEGLALWEEDYGLPGGGSAETRRGRIRGAMAGGQTLTVARLKALAVQAANAQEGQVREDFAEYTVTLTVLGSGALPGDAGMEALRLTVQRQKPAHLRMVVRPGAALPLNRGEALHGGTLVVMREKK